MCRNCGRRPCRELLQTVKSIGGFNLVLFFMGKRNCGIQSVAQFQWFVRQMWRDLKIVSLIVLDRLRCTRADGTRSLFWSGRCPESAEVSCRKFEWDCEMHEVCVSQPQGAGSQVEQRRSKMCVCEWERKKGGGEWPACECVWITWWQKGRQSRLVDFLWNNNS